MPDGNLSTSITHMGQLVSGGTQALKEARFCGLARVKTQWLLMNRPWKSYLGVLAMLGFGGQTEIRMADRCLIES